MRIFSCLFFLTTWLPMVANVTVESQNSGIDNLSGVASITVSGDAAPFNIYLFRDCDGYNPSMNLREELSAVSGSYSFTGLAPNSYCVVVIDKYGCVTEETVVIDVDCGSARVVLEDVQFPSYCLDAACAGTTEGECSDDGSIGFRLVASTDYEVYINGEQYQNNLSRLDDLPVGTYSIRLVDVTSGCSATEMVTLQPCNSINRASSDSPCAVTSGLEQSDEAPASISLALVHSTEGACNGSIELGPLPASIAVVRYVSVSGEVFYPGQGLCPGRYTIELIDGCGDLISKEVRINCIIEDASVDYEVTHECGNDVAVEAHLLGAGDGPFTYSWSRLGMALSSEDFIVYDGHGTLELLVTSVKTGCIVTGFFAYSGTYASFDEAINVCPGESLGELHFHYNNTTDEPITVLLNGIEVDVPITSNSIMIGPLQIGTYDIALEVGGCQFTFANLAITESIVSREFDSYSVEDEVCKYIFICNGARLPAAYDEYEEPIAFLFETEAHIEIWRELINDISGISEAAFDLIGLSVIGSFLGNVLGTVIDFFGGLLGIGGGQSCITPLVCDLSTDVVDVVDLGTEELRTWEYIFLLQNTVDYPRDLLASNLLKVTGRASGVSIFDLEEPCEKIRFCRESLLFLNKKEGFSSIVSAAAGGCPFHCGNFDISDCTNPNTDFLLDFGIEDPCVKIRVESLGKLLYYIEEFPSGSELREYLESVRSFFDADSGNGICLRVTYCDDEDSYKVISSPPLEDLFNSDCGMTPLDVQACINIGANIETNALCDEWEIDKNGCSVRVCSLYITDYSNCLVGTNLSDIDFRSCDISYNIRPFDELVSASYSRRQYISLDISLESSRVFSGFVYEESDVSIVPSFIENISNEQLLRKFGRNFARFPAKVVQGLKEEYRSLQGLKSYRLVELSSHLFGQYMYDGTDVKALILASNSSLSILSMEDVDGSIHLSGQYSDSLFIGDDIKKFSPTSSLFVLRTSYQGDVLSYTQKDVVLGDSYSSSISSESVLFSQNDGWGQFFLVKDSLWHESTITSSGTEVEYIHSTLMKDKALHCFSGTGTVQINSDNFVINGESIVVVVTSDNPSSIFYQKGGVIDTSSLLHYSTVRESAFLVFQEQDSLGYKVDEFEENVLKYSYQIKSNINYRIRQVFQGGRNLYFGGELQSDRGIHQLGEVDFINLNASDSYVPYMSYVDLDY